MLADLLSRLNLPNCDEEDMAYVEEIINSTRLQFDPEMEILEFHEMKKEIATKEIEEEEIEPLEINSFEFFAQALFHFEGEANLKKDHLIDQERQQGHIDNKFRLIFYPEIKRSKHLKYGK